MRNRTTSTGAKLKQGEDHEKPRSDGKAMIVAAQTDELRTGRREPPKLIYAGRSKNIGEGPREDLPLETRHTGEPDMDGIIVYAESCAQDNSCSAWKSKVFVDHRKPTILETNTVIDGGDHEHKVEALATLYAMVAGTRVRIGGIPLVPTFTPNVLSHGRLKKSGAIIRLDEYPP